MYGWNKNFELGHEIQEIFYLAFKKESHPPPRSFCVKGGRRVVGLEFGGMGEVDRGLVIWLDKDKFLP